MSRVLALDLCALACLVAAVTVALSLVFWQFAVAGGLAVLGVGLLALAKDREQVADVSRETEGDR